MSIQAIAWVLECSQSVLGDRCVLIAIANHADSRGKNAWPSVSTIMREARVSERQVQCAVNRLKGIGELVVHYGGGLQGANRYRLPKMAQEFLFHAGG